MVLQPAGPNPRLKYASPDALTLARVRSLLGVVRPMLSEEITTAWLARTLVRVDGGPMLDAPRLGPVLRALGFQLVRRRRGTQRVNTWLQPSVPPARVGRPRRAPTLT